MSNQNTPAYLLREARKRAGLTQRELAARAEKAQSVIARIETGKTSPTSATLNQLLAAAGFELHTELVVKPIVDTHMLDDISRILQLTPEERLEEVKNANRLQTETKRT